MQDAFKDLLLLGKALVRVAIVFVVLIVFFFFVPFSQGRSLAVLAVGKIQHDLLPQGAHIIVTNLLEPFSAEVTLAVQFAFFFTFPYFAFELWRFIAPALYIKERRAVGFFFVSSFILMLLGSLFAYFVVIPRAFKGLYAFVPAGVDPLFSLGHIVSLVSGFTIAVSLLFLLPVAMALLSATGLVSPSFWLVYARHAILLSLIFSAILIPDPSGVSMVLLSIPMCALYLVGFLGGVALAPKQAG